MDKLQFLISVVATFVLCIICKSRKFETCCMIFKIAAVCFMGFSKIKNFNFPLGSEGLL